MALHAGDGVIIAVIEPTWATVSTHEKARQKTGQRLSVGEIDGRRGSTRGLSSGQRDSVRGWCLPTLQAINRSRLAQDPKFINFWVVGSNFRNRSGLGVLRALSARVSNVRGAGRASAGYIRRHTPGVRLLPQAQQCHHLRLVSETNSGQWQCQNHASTRAVGRFP